MFRISALQELFRQTGRVRVHPRICYYKEAVSICRRTLEVAIVSAQDAEEEARAGVHAAAWEELGKAFDKAARSLRHALLVVPRGIGPPYPEAGPAILLPCLKQFHAHEGKIAKIADRSTAAADDAEILFAADALLPKLAAHCKRAASRIRSGRSNPGNPIKLAFVSILAEGWMYLTGRKPVTQPERNPFLNFTYSAWEDAGGPPDENFHRQVRAVVANIPETVDPSSIQYGPPETGGSREEFFRVGIEVF
jgi:hypothetical protein